MINVELVKNPIELSECFGCRKDTKDCLEISKKTREGSKKMLPRFPICMECLNAFEDQIVSLSWKGFASAIGAYGGFFINLFNLLPAAGLDGDRATETFDLPAVLLEERQDTPGRADRHVGGVDHADNGAWPGGQDRTQGIGQ